MDDQRHRQQRHEFKEEVESDEAVRQGQTRQNAQCHQEKAQELVLPPGMAQIGKGEEHGGGPDAAVQQQEKPTDRIRPEGHREPLVDGQHLQAALRQQAHQHSAQRRGQHGGHSQVVASLLSFWKNTATPPSKGSRTGSASSKEHHLVSGRMERSHHTDSRFDDIDSRIIEDT